MVRDPHPPGFLGSHVAVLWQWQTGPQGCGGPARLTGTMVHVPQGGPPPGRWGQGTGQSKLRSPPGVCLCGPTPCLMSL